MSMSMSRPSADMVNIPPHPILFRKQASWTKVHIKLLVLSTDQLSEIEACYANGEHYLREFNKDDSIDQALGREILEGLHLDAERRSSLESKWTKRWSTKSDGKDLWRRILFQCKCGYDETVRQKKDAPSTPGKRQTPYDFTGCLSHVEVSEYIGSGILRRIIGILEHNSGCVVAKMVRLPSIPLHQDVYDAALAQMYEGASMTAVRARNQQLLSAGNYPSMKVAGGTKTPFDKSANWHYNIENHDVQTIYRKYARFLGVDITQQPQYNLDNWLRRDSPDFMPELEQAIFYYAPRIASGSRLVACIATPEMNEAAWRHSHKKQLLLDGTFGVVSSRMLLFIAMGVDDNTKGLPLAFFLFSAPGGTKATHGAYDTSILQSLLAKWKESLGVRHGESFEPYVAITDCDTRERSALLDVWPSVWLLLCKFHLRQCWTAKRKTVLKGGSYWKYHIQSRFHEMERRLLDSESHEDALHIIALERQYLEQNVSDVNLTTDLKSLSQKAISYLEYITSQWMARDIWTSWSLKGRSIASVRTGIPVESIIPTTNHLESFNFVLKYKFIGPHKHSGHRLRFDIFIHLLVKDIIPDVYYRRYIQAQYSNWLKERFAASSGGVDLQQTRSMVEAESGFRGSLLWWTEDTNRDKQAEGIAAAGRLTPVLSSSPFVLRATCASTSANVLEVGHRRYWLELHTNGYGSCQCPDFMYRGGACKHLRAFRRIVEAWFARRLVPYFHFPTSIEDAKRIKAASLPTSTPASQAVLTVQAFQNLMGQSTELQGTDDMEQESSAGEEDQSDPENLCDEAESDFVSNIILFYLEETYCGVKKDPYHAVQMHKQNKIEHQALRVLPILHGIATDLKDLQLDHPSKILDELQETVSDITASMSKIAVNSETSAKPPSRRAETPAPTINQPSGTQYRLLPPSPERASKRQQSRNVV
ncbi:hypothetical protein SCHPADRAFT_886157 [Schizopora paradoxa]|uniref:SWIM-type domain-containing protein n=1 Tax=Schizopora paradoxa TaxID=27342 RepID=A0A0H2S381_9AGAM|nr:hypothetical protein SCHPADRAFT_886157 [Schizopora paradoxa]